MVDVTAQPESAFAFQAGMERIARVQAFALMIVTAVELVVACVWILVVFATVALVACHVNLASKIYLVWIVRADAVVEKTVLVMGDVIQLLLHVFVIMGGLVSIAQTSDA